VARNTERVRKVRLDYCLGAAGGILLVLLAVQLVRYGGARTLGEELIKATLAPEATPQRAEAPDLEQYKAIAEKGLFGKAKQKKGPGVPRLFGVLGEFALLGNSPGDSKPYALGAEVAGGHKLVEIHLDSVVLEKDGKKLTLKVFPDSKVGAAPKEAKPPAETGGGQPGERPPDGRTEEKPAGPPIGGGAEAAAGPAVPEGAESPKREEDESGQAPMLIIEMTEDGPRLRRSP